MTDFTEDEIKDIVKGVITSTFTPTGATKLYTEDEIKDIAKETTKSTFTQDGIDKMVSLFGNSGLHAEIDPGTGGLKITNGSDCYIEINPGSGVISIVASNTINIIAPTIKNISSNGVIVLDKDGVYTEGIKLESKSHINLIISDIEKRATNTPNSLNEPFLKDARI